MIRRLIGVVWLALSMGWVAADRVVRDGDEEGHVGAAELFRAQLDAGQWLRFFDDAWRGQLGEYPPLFPALTGAWWWATGVPQPGHVAVRGVLLLSLLVAAWAASQLAARLCGARGWDSGDRLAPLEAARTTAFLFVLALPLGNGLTRHFMPEGGLIAAVTVAVLAAVWAAERPSPGRAAVLGMALGAGLLTKQTFALYAAIPVLVGGARLGKGWAVTVLTTAVVAGPWYFRHLGAQADYLSRSAGNASGAGALEHLAYYPIITGWQVLGPPLTLAATVALFMVLRSWRPGTRRGAILAVAWLIGGLALLTLVPKKYPRLAAPLAPAAALLAGVAFAHARRRPLTLALWSAPALSWLAVCSVVETAPPDVVARVDPRCPQRWTRPPNPDDLGLGAVAEAVAAAGGGVVGLAGDAEIPCAVQTTHPWSHHLQPYLRREGLEVEVRTGRAPGAAVQLTWDGRQGTVVKVAALDRDLAIE